MAENAPVMIWMSGADGRCQHLNVMLRAFWGVSEKEIAEFDWQKTVHPSDAAEIGTKMLAALSHRTGATVKGRYFNASWTNSTLGNAGATRFSVTGEFLGMIGVNADITEQEFAQGHGLRPISTR